VVHPVDLAAPEEGVVGGHVGLGGLLAAGLQERDAPAVGQARRHGGPRGAGAHHHEVVHLVAAGRRPRRALIVDADHGLHHGGEQGVRGHGVGACRVGRFRVQVPQV